MAEIGTVLSICLNFSAEKWQKSETFCPLLKTLQSEPAANDLFPSKPAANDLFVSEPASND